MNEHGNAGPLSNAAGFVLGCITMGFEFIGNNASTITCIFMMISVIGGLYFTWDRNQILRAQQKSGKNETK